MYQEAFEAIQGLFKTGVIDWFTFYSSGSLGIKFKSEDLVKIFKKGYTSVEILECIEKYEYNKYYNED